MSLVLLVPFPGRANDERQVVAHVSIATTKPVSGDACDCEVVTEPVGTSTWLGLFQDGAGYAWRSTQVHVQWAPNLLAEDRNTRWTSKTIRVSGGERPVVLVRGLPELAKVSVHVAQFARWKPSDLSPGELKVRLADSLYTVKMLAPPESKGKASILLASGGRQQLIDRIDSTEKDWHVVWAGDLDGDGKLDLLVSAEDGEGRSHLNLMLSTYAKGGEMVHTVASRAYAGD